MDHLDHLVIEVQPGLLDQLDHKDHRVQEVKLALKVNKALEEKLVELEHQGLMEGQVLKAHVVSLD